jgi:four helix bundle protein
VLRVPGMGDQADALKDRTRRFAVQILELIKQLPREEPGPSIKRQLAKSATATCANYRAACRSRSHKEFTARIAVVAEEADESATWLGMLADAKLISSPALEPLRQEANELAAIFSASVRTARRKEQAARG